MTIKNLLFIFTFLFQVPVITTYKKQKGEYTLGRTKILISLISLLTCLLLTAEANAGDTSELNILGFSEDGKHIAFEYYGASDGSGFPYYDFFIVNVPRNKYAIRPMRKTISDDTPLNSEELNVDKFRAQFSTKTSAMLKKYNISKQFTGTEITLNKPEQINKTTSRFPFKYDSRDYSLTLKQITTDKDCHYGKGKYFDLRLQRNGKEIILQKDTRIPKSRGCPLDYYIVKVLVYKGYIAVFINVSLPGFEGPDIRQMVVTGTLL